MSTHNDIKRPGLPPLPGPTGSALARCPFCGSSKVYIRFYNQPSVCCEDCLCMGPAAQRLTKDNKTECEQEATLRWNKRVDYSHKVTLAQNTELRRAGHLSNDKQKGEPGIA